MPEVPAAASEIARVRKIVLDDPLLYGRLISKDERMALVRLTFFDDAEPHLIHRGMVELRERFEGPERIILFGREYSNVEMNKAVDQNIGTLLPLAGLLLLVFFYVCFGRWQAVWVALTMIVLSVIDFLGLMGVLGIPQTVLSSTVPVILIVVLGSYVVHLLRRVYEEAERMPWEEAVCKAVARTGGAVAIAAVTTAVGFATLTVFQIYSIREFGILAAAGVLICGALSITWLPAALLVFCRSAPKESMGLRGPYLALIEWLTEGAVRVSSARRCVLLCAVLAFVAASAAGLSQLNLGDAPSKYYASGHPVREAFETFVEHFGGDGYLFVELSAPDGKTAFDPDFLGRVHAFQRDAEEIEHVGYASSVVDRVLMRTHRIMHADDPAYERVPETEALAASYAEVFRWTAPETFAEMTENVDSPRRLVVDVFAEIEDSALIEETVDGLRILISRHFPSPEAGSAVFGGEWFLWIAQNEYIVIGKLLNIALSISLVGLVCLAAMRTVRLAVISVLPAGLAALMLFGIMGVVGIRLNMTTCVLTAIVVGIGVDFAVHFLKRYDEIKENAGPGANLDMLRTATVRRAAAPILYDCFSNVAAFSVCAASPLVPVRDFGWLICFSMLACAAATLGLLPSLVPRERG
jgi:predicted RND superfamily exporter protein